jgi:hypothetical protein
MARRPSTRDARPRRIRHDHGRHHDHALTQGDIRSPPTHHAHAAGLAHSSRVRLRGIGGGRASAWGGRQNRARSALTNARGSSRGGSRLPRSSVSLGFGDGGGRPGTDLDLTTIARRQLRPLRSEWLTGDGTHAPTLLLARRSYERTVARVAPRARQHSAAARDKQPWRSSARAR